MLVLLNTDLAWVTSNSCSWWWYSCFAIILNNQETRISFNFTETHFQSQNDVRHWQSCLSSSSWVIMRSQFVYFTLYTGRNREPSPSSGSRTEVQHPSVLEINHHPEEGWEDRTEQVVRMSLVKKDPSTPLCFIFMGMCVSDATRFTPACFRAINCFSMCSTPELERRGEDRKQMEWE